MEPNESILHLKYVIQKLILLSLALVVVAGCSSPSPSTNTSSTSSASTAEAKMEKCALCGNEFNASDMVIHEGKQVCKACKAAHGG
jgi:hypothetical protein